MFRYNIYFAGFVFCEFLNFFSVVTLICLTHRFLHFRFLAYGFEVKTAVSFCFLRPGLRSVVMSGVAILSTPGGGAENARRQEPSLQCLPKGR